MQLSFSRKLVFGLQHTIAMFGATVLMPLLTGLNPSVALFSAGVGTLIFHFITKRIVPVFLGSSFAFIAPILAAKNAGFSMNTITGGIAAAGLVYIVFSFIALGLGYHRIKKLFPPIVTGPVIIVIGLTLAPVAVQMASKNWALTLVTLVAATLSAVFCRGIFKMIPILMGVSAGYIAALAWEEVDTTPLLVADWFGLPHFTVAAIDWNVIALIAPVAIVTIMEHIGDILTNGRVVGRDFFHTPGLQRTLLGDGVATTLSGIVGGPVLTTYAENTGVLAITKVYDPSVLRMSAVFAILLGLSPKVAALLQTLPTGVLGGISMLLFGMIASIGIRTLAESEIDFAHSRNLIIVSIILVLGLGGATLKLGEISTIGGKTMPFELNGMALAAIVGILLNLLLPQPKEQAS